MKGITGIKETCLYIHDLKGARHFYHTILGFPVIHYEPEKHCFFRVGHSVLLCFNPGDSKEKESPPPHFAEGNQHVAFEVPAEKYVSTKKEFEEKGVDLIDEIKWNSGQYSFYFRDPENNILEIVPEGVWD